MLVKWSGTSGVARALVCGVAVCMLSSSAAHAAPSVGTARTGGSPSHVRYGYARVRSGHQLPLGRYVALGDSEASAPGVPRQVDTRCHRSSHDYPSVVAARLHPAAFSDVTCSGSTTADLAHGQYAALRPDTTLVTLTIGANDIGFSGLVLRCSALGLFDAAGAPCRRLYGTALPQRIAAAAPKVAAALRTVRRRAPRARVLLVGYLNLIPDSHRGCRPRELFASGDLAWLDSTENALDLTLARIARQNGAVFVGQHTASAGHDLCRPAGVRWTEGIRPTSPSIPFHPNAAGEAAMAAGVLAATAG